MNFKGLLRTKEQELEHLCDRDEGYSIPIQGCSAFNQPEAIGISLFQDYVNFRALGFLDSEKKRRTLL